MIIRDFKPQERDIYINMAETFYSSDATLYDIPNEYLQAAFDQGLKQTPLMRMLLLLDTDEHGAEFPVGYAHLAFSWSCEAGGKVCWLEELYINNEYRGRGYGKAFMNWLLNTYSESCRRFRLEVCPKNEAVKKMYEHMGFEALNYLQMTKER